mmetsp:Transcript_12745/g.23141  ORF Transcript_12745/g.23141 Transcript_12745/m.23141 type:complete len:185 (-) Transcript_12745:325-879(-)
MELDTLCKPEVPRAMILEDKSSLYLKEDEVEDYYGRILELYFTLRKQRQHKLPELKTRFKISTGYGPSLFMINSHSQFEVLCGLDEKYLFPYTMPVSSALKRMIKMYQVIKCRDKRNQVARALLFSRLSGPSRTQSQSFENMLLTNPDLYLRFRTLIESGVIEKCIADIVVDYYVSLNTDEAGD